MSKKKGRKYKIRLTSGRILGPIDLQRVKDLLLKNRFTGEEDARAYPSGEWLNINQIPEINDLFMSRLEGRLEEDSEVEALEGPEIHQPIGDSAPTVILSEDDLETTSAGSVLPGAETRIFSKKVTKKDEAEEPTIVETEEFDPADYERTEVGDYEPFDDQDEPAGTRELLNPITNEETILFERSPSRPVAKYKIKPNRLSKMILWGLVVVWVATEIFWSDPESSENQVFHKIKPRMPFFLKEKSDPEKSKKLFSQGISFYLKDNVVGYAKAAHYFHSAASFDSSNVKALALLASCYLNLIDSTSQDENYFSIVKKLIELSKSKSIDLAEAVIADVEFFLTINRAESARTRIIEYTKAHQKFEVEMLYYMAAVFFARGETIRAVRYIQQIPKDKIFSPKVLFLKGKIAEQLKSPGKAAQAYLEAIKLFPKHAKSRLRLSVIYAKNGELTKAKPYLDFLVKNPSLLSLIDLSKAYYYHARLNLVKKNRNGALNDLKKAVALNARNHDYLLEYYTIRGQGDNDESLKATAKMYYSLSQGEKFLRENRYQDALAEFIRARNSDLDSPVPLEKIGDTFRIINDIRNAKLNYEKAALMQPKNISIWSKYIHILIESFEWEETKKAMSKFRSNPKAKSTIDKLAGDLYAKQGVHQQALIYYRRAMSRETIDPEVYIAYANGLVVLGNCSDAPFFFALARRYDIHNVNATVGIARCIAKEESPSRAIVMLEDELQKSSSNRAQILSEIAHLQIQTGEYRKAKKTIAEAKKASPILGEPFKYEAELLLNQNEMTPKILKNALIALSSYIERNPSDPDAFIKKYQIHIRLTEYEKAGEELDQIYARYPKFPNLHYYKGQLFSLMGNRKEAHREYQIELSHHPSNVNAMVALGTEMLEKKSFHDALKYFNQAMQFAPGSATPKAMAGYANYLLKNYHGAVALYRAALKIDEANPLIYKRLGLAYRALGDSQNASKSFKKYIQVAPDAPDRSEIERYI